MEDDWDLHAVVRGCATTSSTTTTTTTTTTTATTTSSCSFQPRANDGDDQFIFFPDPFESRIAENGIDLHDVFKPFFPKSQTLLSPQNTPISPLSVLGGLRDLSAPPQQQQLQEEKQKQKQSVSGARTSCTSVSTTTTSHTPRSKRRKNQSKRVCQVPAEGLSSDTWSWRKYGQKPIKGSPYPRWVFNFLTTSLCIFNVISLSCFGISKVCFNFCFQRQKKKIYIYIYIALLNVFDVLPLLLKAKLHWFWILKARKML
ncbi:hypothetical protein ACSBR1_005025 [Camellia fascicularis]